MKSITQIQDAFIEKVNVGYQRWKHRKDGGHMSRIRRGAWNTAYKQFRKLGFDDGHAKILIEEAEDIAKLQREAEEE